MHLKMGLDNHKMTHESNGEGMSFVQRARGSLLQALTPSAGHTMNLVCSMPSPIVRSSTRRQRSSPLSLSTIACTSARSRGGGLCAMLAALASDCRSWNHRQVSNRGALHKRYFVVFSTGFFYMRYQPPPSVASTTFKVL